MQKKQHRKPAATPFSVLSVGPSASNRTLSTHGTALYCNLLWSVCVIHICLREFVKNIYILKMLPQWHDCRFLCPFFFFFKVHSSFWGVFSCDWYKILNPFDSQEYKLNWINDSAWFDWRIPFLNKQNKFYLVETINFKMIDLNGSKVELSFIK